MLLFFTRVMLVQVIFILHVQWRDLLMNNQLIVAANVCSL